MTAAKVIAEIIRLHREEQARVLEFAFELARSRQLSGAELAKLDRQLIDAQDLVEMKRLKAELTRGFYGHSKENARRRSKEIGAPASGILPKWHF